MSVLRDGRYRYQFRSDPREDREYLDGFVIPAFNREIAIPLRGRPVRGMEDRSAGSYGICVDSKPIVEFFTGLGMPTGPKGDISIPEEFYADRRFHAPLLRGLFDTDGSVFFQKNYSSTGPARTRHGNPKLELGTTSPRLAGQVFAMLQESGFKPYRQAPYKGRRDRHAVRKVGMSGRAQVDRWQQQVGFHNPKHETKYQVWKKFGFCPPYTSLAQRQAVLRGESDPSTLYGCSVLRN